jgi:hypothetical protein
MQLTLKVTQDDRGQFCARCPELGISTTAQDKPGAVDRLKTMILEALTYDPEVWMADLADDGTADDGPCRDMRALLCGDDGIKCLILPHHQRLH